MNFCLSSSGSHILFVLLLLSGCSTNSRTSIESQWPLQAGSNDIYQYYEGESLPLEEVAVLDVCTPLGIRKQISPMAFTAKKNYYYSGKFSLMPGKQTVALSYIGASGTAYYSSQSVEISFYAEKGRLYRTFYVGNLYLHLETKNCEDLHRFHVKILDVTDREALSKIANSGRFEAFRREARAMLQQLDGNPGADASAK